MISEIYSIHQPEVRIFGDLTEAQLRQSGDAGGEGLFIAESPKVIKVALKAGYQPVALLCERRHITGDAADIIAGCGETMPVYTGDRDMLASLTGYTLTRGVLCAMRRKPLPGIEDICGNASRLVVIDSVTDTTNIGAIFRSAAALGIDGVILTSTSCDPLNRRSIRVSMGTVFQVPWTWTDNIEILRQQGFKTAALALRHDSCSIDSPVLKAEPRLALVMGTEGDGLSDQVIRDADYVVRIPMYHDVDSLNVAAATALACWELSAQRR